MSGEQHQIVGIGMGVAGAYAAMKLGQDYASVMIAVGSALGCWLPDMDHDRTKLGRKRKVVTETTSKIVTYGLMTAIVASIVVTFLVIRGLMTVPFDTSMLIICAAGAAGILILKHVIGNSKEFKWAAKHRGLMHTLLPLVPLLLLSRVSSYPLWTFGCYGLALGYASHLFADCLTTEGCPLLYPVAKFNIRIPVCDTDKKRQVGCWVVAVGSVALVHFLL